MDVADHFRALKKFFLPCKQKKIKHETRGIKMNVDRAENPGRNKDIFFQRRSTYCILIRRGDRRTDSDDHL